MEKSIKKITLKKEAISNLNNSQMNSILGGAISMPTLPQYNGCDSINLNCCTYNQCGNYIRTVELCNTYEINGCRPTSNNVEHTECGCVTDQFCGNTAPCWWL